jgi:hypothetical protein
MMASNFPAAEMTAHQAWFLADHLRVGSYPWSLAITAPYTDPGEKAAFDEQCRADLTETRVLDEEGNVVPAIAAAVKTACQPRQWLQWLTIIDQDRILRGVLARTSPPDAVVVLRYAQMVTLTPLQLHGSESLVPIITAGLPEDQRPAHFEEFSIPMDTGKAIDDRIGRGAEIVETLVDLGVPEREAEIMELARTGERITIELTAHEATNGARNNTDVSVNVISTEVGSILVSPPAGEPREGGSSVFAPAEPFAVAMAIRDLTDRLPSGTWFPEENFSI